MASWKNSSLKILRAMISDLDETAYIYTDDRLLSLLIISAASNSLEIDFSSTYTVNVCTTTITPEPDIQFIILMVLKALCIVREGEYKTASSSAISFKDGPSSIDSRDKAIHYKNLMDKACANLDRARLSYQFGDGSVGQAIIGPYTAGYVYSGTTFN